jgi:hypothetical protein
MYVEEAVNDSINNERDYLRGRIGSDYTVVRSHNDHRYCRMLISESSATRRNVEWKVLTRDIKQGSSVELLLRTMSLLANLILSRPKLFQAVHCQLNNIQQRRCDS